MNLEALWVYELYVYFEYTWSFGRGSADPKKLGSRSAFLYLWPTPTLKLMEHDYDEGQVRV